MYLHMTLRDVNRDKTSSRILPGFVNEMNEWECQTEMSGEWSSDGLVGNSFIKSYNLR